MVYNSSITFGGVTMNIQTNNLRKVKGTHKQIIGGEIVLKPAPEKAKEWRGVIRGTFIDSNRNTDKASLNTIRENAIKVSLSDGEHDGEYYVLGLDWNDDASHTATSWRFNLEVVQDI